MRMRDESGRPVADALQRKGRTAVCRPKSLFPAFLISLAMVRPGLAFQDNDSNAAAKDKPSHREDSRLQSLLDDAERLLDRTTDSRRENVGLVRKENAELLESARKLTDSETRTTSLSELTVMLSGQKEFTTAREAALEIDQTQLVEKVRSLNTVARAEAASDDVENAWLTLHEAQKLALELNDPEQLIGLMREIGTVERELRGTSAKLASAGGGNAAGANDSEIQTSAAEPRLDPEPREVIRKVLETGIPPTGYQEIEVVREGGGPLREARAIAHTYYYNGNRIFQGPMFPGGPTDIHAIHPRTGESCIFRVNMPTGTPFIEYSKHSIEYHYPQIVVELNFRRNGGHDVDYRTLFNKYAHERKKVLTRRQQTLHAISGGGTGNTVSQLLNIGVGAPLNLVKRLPIVSDLLNRDANRIPATLKVPVQLSP
jgi:hypothetical protein